MSKGTIQTCGTCHHYRSTPEHKINRRHECPNGKCRLLSECATKYVSGHMKQDAIAPKENEEIE